MIKKITALMLVVAIMLSVPVFAFSDVDEDNKYSDAINSLAALGILSGMGDGTFEPKGTLTRAQFAKIAVYIMGKEDEAVVKTEAFSDVKARDWYSGFVNVVAKENIITGYPDGSFGANEAITYAQTVAILIRLLGYSEADVGYKWPSGYIEKAGALGISEGMSISANEPVTRDKAAQLIYNALMTQMKETSSLLITRMDKNVFEDALVLATKSENSSLLENQVQTDKGIFSFDEDTVDMKSFLGYEGTMVVNDEAEIMVFVPDDDMRVEEYTVKAVYSKGNTDIISIITDENEAVDLNNKTTVYMDGSELNAANLSEGLNAGSRISLFYEKGLLKYAFADEYKYEGPKTAGSESVYTLFDIEKEGTLKVIRKGLSAGVEDIQKYDVLYYSERTNTIYAYANRVTGSYDEALPMKSNVSRVVVSGKEYSLSTINAINKLNESENAFDIGDRVTLLLGEDGTVTDVVNLTESDISSVGVIIETGREISEDEEKEGRMEYYVKILNTNGEEVKLTVKDDSYTDKAGAFCEVGFEDSNAVLTFPKTSNKTGLIDKDANAMGDVRFASDYAVMEYIDGNDEKATVNTIKLSELDGYMISKGDIKHLELNKKGEIVFLYLDSFTGNHYTYGVVTSVPKDGEGAKTNSGAFAVLSGGSTVYVSGTYPSIKLGDGVRYYKGLEGVEFTLLSKVCSDTDIKDITDNIITVGNKSYTLSDDVIFYAGDRVEKMSAVSLKDAEELGGIVTLYADKHISGGGKVKVVTILTV